MEELPLTVEKIVGNPGEDIETGVTTRNIPLSDGSSGTLILCAVAWGDAAILQVVFGYIFDLASKRIEDGGDNILESLKATASSAEKYTSDKNIELSFILTFFYKDVCYVARLGDKVRIL